MKEKDYYKTLGVSKTASQDEIKSAFRKKAKEYHPDINKEAGAEEKFKEIGEAYSVLSDEAKRRQYDQFGSQSFNGNQGSGFSGFDFSDFDLGSIFEQFMGGGFSQRSSAKRAQRGDDYLVTINLSFEEAVFGTDKKFDVTIDENCTTCHGEGGHDKETCTHCNGRGRIIREQRTILGVMQTESICPYCSGSGYTFKKTCDTCKGRKTVKTKKSLTLKVPKGIEQGDQMRMSGRGGAGSNGGVNGDIYINFTVKEHKLFKREGKDIFIEVPLTILEAIDGVKKTIPTPYGNIEYNFSSGTQNNETIKLRGKGIDSSKSKIKGDLYLITKVIIPTKLDRKQKSILKDLSKTKLNNEDIFKDFNKYID